MTAHRHYLLTPLLCCLLISGCAGSLKSRHRYLPPPGTAPMQLKSVETGELRSSIGFKGDSLGAEVISSETVGEEQSIEVWVPIKPGEVDQVEIMSPSGEPVKMSREAQIIHNYETDDVGIRFKIPNSDNLGFRLRLIDNGTDDWPPMRVQ